MAVKITYFVHGTTTDNEQGLSTGQAPGELSELGIKQSIELKEQVKDKEFDVIFSSDLKRAIDSVNLSFDDRDIPKLQDKRLRECDYGDLTGAEELEYIDYIDKRFPNGENMKDVEKRIKEFLGFLKEDYDGKRIAIMAHKASQLAIEVIINKKTWEQAINEDWRKTKAWKPGWEYILE